MRPLKRYNLLLKNKHYTLRKVLYTPINIGYSYFYSTWVYSNKIRIKTPITYTNILIVAVSTWVYSNKIRIKTLLKIFIICWRFHTTWVYSNKIRIKTPWKFLFLYLIPSTWVYSNKIRIKTLLVVQIMRVLILREYIPIK